VTDNHHTSQLRDGKANGRLGWPAR